MKLTITILAAAVLVLTVLAIMQYRAMVNMDNEIHQHLALLNQGHYNQQQQIDRGVK